MTSKQYIDKQAPIIRDEGVYLITGGAGKIGLHFAEYLARKYKARLVLAGRSSLTSTVQEKLTELKRLGAEVLYVQADVAGQHEVKSLVAKARRRFGRIDGVFHCAGVLQDSLIIRKTWDDFESVLAPKVLGATYLDEETKDDELDFFVMCSSLVSVLGNVGQSDYAFANRFMDEYAVTREALRRNGERSGKSVSISWPLWKNGGMRVTPETEKRLEASWGMVPMLTHDGMEVLETVLRSGESHMIVVAGDKVKLDKLLLDHNQGDSQAGTVRLRDSRSSSREVPVSRDNLEDEGALIRYIENLLKTVVATETKFSLEAVALSEPLERYGIDSLLIVAITRKLEDTFGELSKTLFFEYQTISELVEYFMENHRDQITKLVSAAMPASSLGSPADKSLEQKVRVGYEPPLSPLSDGQRRSSERAQSESFAAEESEDDIAIIGMAGQFPMAKTLWEFWDNLKQGQDGITEVPPDRWDYREFSDATKWGGFIDDIDMFDPLFFNISNREAEWLDPQERLFLQTVYHTLEDAGYTKKTLADQRVGVYAGLMWGQYQLYGVDLANAASSYGSIANRVSYFFNFSGPSIALDTMCSSSLVTIHLACESIKRGESDVAIAGGVNLNVHPHKHLFLALRGFAASDGRCRSFGEGGDGYVASEGVGAVLLKPLRQAKIDGDYIYGVIKATATNHGGKTNGYTVPNPKAQTNLILEALSKAKIDPRTISYIEAHGTGTALGDPIEITGLTNAFKKYTTDTQFCSIGSVKSNIGHLEGAAGVVGIIKVLLQMKYKQLVPSIHSENLNPNINFTKTPFAVQRELTNWNQPVIMENGTTREYPRRAGVSSFGAGGTNAHIIVEEYQEESQAVMMDMPDSFLVTLSAKNQDRLKKYAQEILEFLEEVPLDDAREETRKPRAEDKLDSIEQRIQERIAETLALSVQLLDIDDSFEDYTLYPNQLNQLAYAIGEEFGLKLSAEELKRHGSPLFLSQHLSMVYPSHSATNGSYQANGGESTLTLANMAYTLQTGRESMEERLAIIVSTRQDLKDKLNQFVSGQEDIPNVYVGSLGPMDILSLAGKEGSDFIENLIRNRRLSKLAKLWCRGLDIDWRRMYDPQYFTRVSLPMYPFAKERCWVSDPTIPSPTKSRRLHPLLDRVNPSLSLGAGMAFEKSLTRIDPIVRDYTVQGVSTLSWSACLGIADAALCGVEKEEYFKLSSLQWSEPLTIGDGKLTMRVIAKEEVSENIHVSVVSGRAQEEKNHIKGSFTRKKEQENKAQRVSLKETRARCHTVVNSEEVYTRLSDAGLEYGEYYRVLHRIAMNDTEAIGEFILPTRYEGELSKSRLFPGVTEGILQTVRVFGLGSAEASTPSSVGELQLLKTLPSQGYVYVRVAGDRLYNAAILDSNGYVCLKIQQIRVGESRPLPVKLDTHSSKPNESVLEKFFYVPQWVEYSTTDSGTVEAGRSVTLGGAGRKSLTIYSKDSIALKQTIAEMLSGGETFEIMLGSDTRLISKNCWEVDTQDPSAIDQCLTYIKGLDTIYFLGGVQTGEFRIDDGKLFQQSQEQGVLSLLRLVKSLDLTSREINLKIITNNVHQVTSSEKTRPFSATLIGLARAVSKEYPLVKTSIIDLDLSSDSIWNGQWVPDDAQLYALFEGNERNESAIRNGRAYKRVLVPIHLPTTNDIPFDRQGVYLVLGGTGNVGFKTSRYLAESVGARIAWFGRRELDHDIREKMSKIESLGGEVQYFRADISDHDSMMASVKEVERGLGHIRGVFHSAMDFSFARIRNLDEERLQDAVRAKTTGTLVLQRVLKELAVDFVVFYSSGESFTGNPGWSAYGAGCSFQDAVSLFMGEQEPYRVHVINWGFWDGNARGESEILKAKGIYPISYDDGMEALKRVLVHNVRQVMALNVEDRILKLMGVDFSTRMSVGPRPVDSVSRPQEISSQAEVASLLGTLSEPEEPVSGASEESRARGEELFGQVREYLTIPISADQQAVSSNDWFAESISRPEIPSQEEAPSNTLKTPSEPQERPVRGVGFEKSGAKGGDIEGQLCEYLTGVMSDVLKIDQAKFDHQTDLANYGVDSLLVIGIHKALEEKLGSLPGTLLIEYPTIEEIAQFLLENHRSAVEKAIYQETDQVIASPYDLFDEPPLGASVDKSVRKTELGEEDTNKNIRIIRVIERESIPQFLENYGDNYRNKLLGKIDDELNERARLEQFDDQLVQSMVEISGGKQIEVILKGQGVPILFLPAVALTAPVWFHQFRDFPPGYQLIVIHAPGYGLSEPIKEATTKGVSRVFMEVIEKLNIKQPIHIVASCFGGLAAQYIAREYKDDVASLTLCGCFFDNNIGIPDLSPEDLSIDEVLALTETVSSSLKRDFDNIIEMVETKNKHLAEKYQRCSDLLLNSRCANPLIAMRYLNELLTLSTLEWLPDVTAPTLCVAGNYDSVVDPQTSRILNAKIPNSRLIEINGAGHYPFLTHSEIFNERLLEHIAEQESRASERVFLNENRK